MTASYLTNITPDSFSGYIFAFEGIRNAVVLMNGPTGCKFYHSATADHQTLRQTEFDPLGYPELWYFGQPRVPCTFLDKRDYVYGSRDKLEEALAFLKENVAFDLIAIVNSPGAALIGDDLEAIARRCLPAVPVVTVASPGYSRPFWQGFAEACNALIDTLCLDAAAAAPSRSRSRVNLLGLSIFHRYYEGDLIALRHMLDQCGVDLNCALCCDCTAEEIRALGDADLNVVVAPEYGLLTARKLKQKYRTPWLTGRGLPVGFAAMEDLASEICSVLGTDPGAFKEVSERARARAYIHLSRLNSLTGLPKGASFAIQGTASQCEGYVRFLADYLGMVPACVSVLDARDDGEASRDGIARLKAYLAQIGAQSALEADILDTKAGLVFADGSTIARLKARHHTFSGVEISLPSLGYTDVLPKTHFGPEGGLLLCETVINGLVY